MSPPPGLDAHGAGEGWRTRGGLDRVEGRQDRDGFVVGRRHPGRAEAGPWDHRGLLGPRAGAGGWGGDSAREGSVSPVGHSKDEDERDAIIRQLRAELRAERRRSQLMIDEVEQVVADQIREQEAVIASQQQRIEDLEEEVSRCHVDLTAERHKVHAMLRRLDRYASRERHGGHY